MKTKKSTLDPGKLKRLISQGNLDKVLDELILFIEGAANNMTTEVYHTSARFRRLEAERLRGEISMKDYKTEFNSITLSLLEILDSVGEMDHKFFRDVPSKEQVKKEIKELAVEFAKTDRMSNIPSMLRMKIHIARKMAEKLMLFPDLVREYIGTTDLAVICAIGRKVKIVPDIADLDVLESIVPNARTNVAKGFLTNALAELIYAGQLRIGDDERLYELLRTIKQEGGDRVLLSNVERVEAALDYLTGRSRA